MSHFYRDGNKIISLRSNNLVATLQEDGEIVMAGGYNAHAKRVREFLAGEESSLPAEGDKKCSDPVPPADPPAEPPAEKSREDEYCPGMESFAMDQEEELPKEIVFSGVAAGSGTGISALMQPNEGVSASREQVLVDQIPEDLIPSLDPVHGVNAPSFIQFCGKYDLSDEQKLLIIKRMERKLYKGGK